MYKYTNVDMEDKTACDFLHSKLLILFGNIYSRTTTHKDPEVSKRRLAGNVQICPIK